MLYDSRRNVPKTIPELITAQYPSESMRRSAKRMRSRGVIIFFPSPSVSPDPSPPPLPSLPEADFESPSSPPASKQAAHAATHVPRGPTRSQNRAALRPERTHVAEGVVRGQTEVSAASTVVERARASGGARRLGDEGHARDVRASRRRRHPARASVVAGVTVTAPMPP